MARDNALLEERTRIMETLSHLLDAINHASTEQRSVIDNLVSSSAATLNQANSQFIAHVSSESAKLGDIAAQWPDADLTQLRTLRRNALRETELDKPPRAFRELFRALRELIVEGKQGDEDAGETPLYDIPRDDNDD